MSNQQAHKASAWLNYQIEREGIARLTIFILLLTTVAMLAYTWGYAEGVHNSQSDLAEEIRLETSSKLPSLLDEEERLPSIAELRHITEPPQLIGPPPGDSLPSQQQQQHDSDSRDDTIDAGAAVPAQGVANITSSSSSSSASSQQRPPTASLPRIGTITISPPKPVDSPGDAVGGSSSSSSSSSSTATASSSSSSTSTGSDPGSSSSSKASDSSIPSVAADALEDDSLFDIGQAGEVDHYEHTAEDYGG